MCYVTDTIDDYTHAGAATRLLRPAERGLHSGLTLRLCGRPSAALRAVAAATHYSRHECSTRARTLKYSARLGGQPFQVNRCSA
eukprot:5435751-Prymnesium_polylepis.1